MRTGNPALTARTFQSAGRVAGDEAMTIQGTVNKTLLLLLFLLVPAAYVWNLFFTQPEAALFMPLTMGGAIGGFVVALVTIFKKDWSMVTAPLYAVLEGLFIGGISSVMEAQFPGIVIQAVALTFGTLIALLFAYKSGLIKVTENFKLGVVAATGGIALIYLISFVLRMFVGYSIPFIHEGGLLGIGFSLFVVVIAALNLVLDFDFIEQGAEQGAPSYMEWYASFGLLITLVWLYIEILRLLSKLRER